MVEKLNTIAGITGVVEYCSPLQVQEPQRRNLSRLAAPLKSGSGNRECSAHRQVRAFFCFVFFVTPTKKMTSAVGPRPDGTEVLTTGSCPGKFGDSYLFSRQR